MSSVLKATALITFFSILSRVLGAVRQAVFAHEFGAGETMDVYVAAFRLPDLIFNLLILGTLSAAFIPVFVEYLNRNREEALSIASAIFSLTAVVMAGASFLGMLLSPVLVKLLVPGFPPEMQAKTIALTRVLMLSPFLFSLSSVAGAVLHSFKKFLLPAIAPLVYNLSIIFGVLFFYPRAGIIGLAWGVVLGALLHFLIQLPAVIKSGVKLFSDLKLAHPGVRKIGKLFLPRVFGIELGQISLLAASVAGSMGAAGTLSVFYFAYDLETVPIGILAVSYAIAAFPTMTEYWAKHDRAGLKKFMKQIITRTLAAVIPLTLFVIMARRLIVKLVLGWGRGSAFTPEHIELTAAALGIFALSYFAQSLVPQLARAFYAMQNTAIPVLSGLLAAVINIILAIQLSKFYGVSGLAAAFSVAITVHMLIMLVLLWKRF